MYRIDLLEISHDLMIYAHQLGFTLWSRGFPTAKFDYKRLTYEHTRSQPKFPVWVMKTSWIFLDFFVMFRLGLLDVP